MSFRHRGKHQLAEILSLLAPSKTAPAWRKPDAVDETGDLLTEILLYVFIGDISVLDGVVQQPSDNSGHVELELDRDTATSSGCAK